jgi:catechol 2,3-dioxygenase-like lactoylglutathione lyase family enzyme
MSESTNAARRPVPETGILLTHFIVSNDIERSKRFYADVLGGEVVREGAEFLTPPMDRGAEFRCYVRDPDGHLIEVGQTTARPRTAS